MQIINILVAILLSTILMDSVMTKNSPCPKIDFIGRVKYRKQGRLARFRCNKKMRRHGPRVLNCKNGAWDGTPPVCIGSGCVPIDTSKVNMLHTEDFFKDGSMLKFQCTGNYHLMGDKEIFCNGRDWSGPLPYCAAPEELMECDFEQGLCGWSQDTTDEQDWVRHQGPTQTGKTGPKYDHTFMNESGNYMFFETSSPTAPHDRARLVSSVFSETLSPMCFDFWYHILGPDEEGHVGTLELFVKGESEDVSDLTALFDVTGNHGDLWHRADIFIEERTEPYQIVIQATKLQSYISDIAIDDLRLYNCTELTTTTSTTTTTETPSTSPTGTSTTTTTMTPSTTPTSAAPVSSSKVATTKSESSKSSTTAPVISSDSAKISPTTSSSTTLSSKLVPTIVSTVPPTSSKSTTKPTITSTAAPTTTSTTSKPTTKPSTTTTTTLKTRTTPSTTTTTTTKRPTTSKTTTKVTSTTSTTTTSTTIKPPPTTRRPIRTTTTTSTITTTPTPPIRTTKTTQSTTTTTKKTTTTKPPTPKKTIPSSTTTSTIRTTPTITSASTTRSTTTLPTTKQTTIKTVKSSEVPTTTKVTPKPTKKSTNSTTVSSTSLPSASTDSGSSTKAPKKTDKPDTAEAAGASITHPGDETLKPLMIGLGVGIVAGLITIGVIAYVCVRRKRYYTSRYEDELKPITKSGSNGSLNNGIYYHDEYHDHEDMESES